MNYHYFSGVVQDSNSSFLQIGHEPCNFLFFYTGFNMKNILKIYLFLYLILLNSPVKAEDWPGFLGPKRNGQAFLNIETFVKEPQIMWSVNVGEGFSGPVVFAETVFLHHRNQNTEEITSFSLKSGKVNWRKSFPTNYKDDFSRGDGPRSTPAVNKTAIICISPDGKLRALNITNGELLWEKDLVSEFESNKIFFGFGSSPLILDEKLIVMAGGNKAGCICINIKTGTLIWKSESFKGSYSSPVVAKFNKQDCVILFHRDGLSVFNLTDGLNLGMFPWRARFDASVNASTPLVKDEEIFLTASYGTGAAWLKFNQGKFEKIWANDTSLSCHFGTPIISNGFLYGFHGRQESGPEFRCVNLKTGEVLWSKDGTGSGNLIKFSSHYLLLAEDGTLFLNKFNSTKWEPVFSQKILNNACRAQPAFSDKFLLARDGTKLICLQITP